MSTLSIILLTALAGPPSPAELDAKARALSDNGRELYALADRVAAHQASCVQDPSTDADLLRGYLDTSIAAAWAQPPKRVAACQVAVLDLFRCQEKQSSAKIRAGVADDNAPRPCAAERAAERTACSH